MTAVHVFVTRARVRGGCQCAQGVEWADVRLYNPVNTDPGPVSDCVSESVSHVKTLIKFW